MADARKPKALFVGLATVDVIYSVQAIPQPDEKISVPGQQISAGGPAANAAVTFAALGGRAALVTAVGAHSLASAIREDLSTQAVRLHDVARVSRKIPPVSSIMVLRNTGERSVVSANATAFGNVNAEFNWQWLRGASILLVDGHYMRMCIAAARLARERGVTVVMDSGSWKQGMSELLRYVDVAICSDNYRPPGCRTIEDVFGFLRRKGIRQIAITRGASPLRFEEPHRRGNIAVKQIHPKDTLGAGDVFHGAFCYYVSQSGTSFRHALYSAARIATFSCKYPGTRAWINCLAKGKK